MEENIEFSQACCSFSAMYVLFYPTSNTKPSIKRFEKIHK